MRRWLALLVTMGVAVGLGAVGGPRAVPVQAQTGALWDVTVGTDVEAEQMETNAFLPSTLTVHVGDTVSWRFAGFHTVTFLSGQPVPALLVPGPDPGSLMAGPAFFPIPLSPMPPGGPYDGRSLISSGTPEADPADAPPFVLTLTAPGFYPYLCAVHPGMAGSVTVLAAGSPLPETPEQAKGRGMAEFAAIQGALKGAIAGVQSAATTARGGVGVHTVAAGVNSPIGASKLGFLSDSLTVRRGDVVTWLNADSYNPHTVTFVSGGTAPSFGDPVLQPDGPPLIVFGANVVGPAGGSSYTGQGYVNSGILFAGQSFALTIDAPAGTYTYFCVIHGTESGGMKATITVTE